MQNSKFLICLHGSKGRFAEVSFFAARGLERETGYSVERAKSSF